MLRISFYVLLIAFLAAPAMADIFGIKASNPLTTFSGNTFLATDYLAGFMDGTSIHVFGIQPDPTAFAKLMPINWDVGPQDFSLSMTISNITGNTADGSGWFKVKDLQGDFISGDLSGVWTRDDDRGKFAGSLSNVNYISVADDSFDGHVGSMSMNLSPEPWYGFISGITGSGAWFDHEFSVAGGSMDARIVAPLPAAFALGILGLGMAGVKLRKHK